MPVTLITLQVEAIKEAIRRNKFEGGMKTVFMDFLVGKMFIESSMFPEILTGRCVFAVIGMEDASYRVMAQINYQGLEKLQDEILDAVKEFSENITSALDALNWSCKPSLLMFKDGIGVVSAENPKPNTITMSGGILLGGDRESENSIDKFEDSVVLNQVALEKRVSKTPQPSEN